MGTSHCGRTQGAVQGRPGQEAAEHSVWAEVDIPTVVSLSACLSSTSLLEEWLLHSSNSLGFTKGSTLLGASKRTPKHTGYFWVVHLFYIRNSDTPHGLHRRGDTSCCQMQPPKFQLSPNAISCVPDRSFLIWWPEWSSFYLTALTCCRDSQHDWI